MNVDETKECVAQATSLIASESLHQQLEGIRVLDELSPYGRLMRVGLTEQQAHTILRAAFREYPPSENFLDLGRSYQQKLLSILCQSPHPSLAPTLLELYPQIIPDDDQARWQALELLSQMPQRAAVKSWIRWYTERFNAGNGVPPPFSCSHVDPTNADLLLPAMVKFSKSDDAWLADQWNAHLSALLAKLPPQSTLLESIIEDLQHLLDQLRAFPLRPPGNWMWESGYFDLRWKISSRAEVLGHTSTTAIDALRRASQSDDPKIRLAAVISLLQLDAPICGELLLPVASWPETRYPLYLQLRRMKKTRLFPRKFARQDLLAESDLVTYLIHDGDPPPEFLSYAGSLPCDGNTFHAFEFGSPDDRSLGLSGPWPENKLEKLHQCGNNTRSCKRDNLPLLDQAAKFLSTTL